jgi:phosphoglycerate dehydrogenase-like enzyme
MQYAGILLIFILMVPSWCVSAELPPILQGLGLRESAVASRELPGWKPPHRVVVRNAYGQDLAAQLGRSVPGVEFVGVTSVAQATKAVPGAQVLIGFCEQQIFAAADELHWVQHYWAGVENCVSLPALQAGGLVLTNGQRLSGPTIAEHTLAMMFSLLRGLPGYYQSQSQGKWQPQNNAAMGELSGRTLLVVGLGGIGTQLARRANALGMRVIATRGSRREGPAYVEYVGLATEAVELSRRADFVVNAAPLTAQTRGMFNADFFEAMKPTAFFISVGRGQSTVTADLVAALEQKQIAGAALDVADPEPLPPGHVLWNTAGVIITPHVASGSRESAQRVGALVAENLRRYIAGEPLLSVVDVKRGY